MLIRHPRPERGRQEFLGVTFRDGVADVDALHPDREAALLQHGATFEITGTPLSDLKAAELRDLAKREGLTVPRNARRADLLELLGAAGTVLSVNGNDHTLGE